MEGASPPDGESGTSGMLGMCGSIPDETNSIMSAFAHHTSH